MIIPLRVLSVLSVAELTVERLVHLSELINSLLLLLCLLFVLLHEVGRHLFLILQLLSLLCGILGLLKLCRMKTVDQDL